MFFFLYTKSMLLDTGQRFMEGTLPERVATRVMIILLPCTNYLIIRIITVIYKLIIMMVMNNDGNVKRAKIGITNASINSPFTTVALIRSNI